MWSLPLIYIWIKYKLRSLAAITSTTQQHWDGGKMCTTSVLVLYMFKHIQEEVFAEQRSSTYGYHTIHSLLPSFFRPINLVSRVKPRQFIQYLHNENIKVKKHIFCAKPKCQQFVLIRVLKFLLTSYIENIVEENLAHWKCRTNSDYISDCTHYDIAYGAYLYYYTWLVCAYAVFHHSI